MSDWLLIIAMSFITFIPRYLPFGLASVIKIPPTIASYLKFVPIAVLTSIITNSSIIREGVLSINFTNYYLYAALVSFVVAKITNHLFIIVLSGMSVFYIIKWII
tara:strand:- start:214 stop:528 length:315 start_codon:yes stop_codon:yes gene_type:complete